MAGRCGESFVHDEPGVRRGHVRNAASQRDRWSCLYALDVRGVHMGADGEPHRRYEGDRQASQRALQHRPVRCWKRPRFSQVKVKQLQSSL